MEPHLLIDEGGQDGENLVHEPMSTTSPRAGEGCMSGMAHTLAGRDMATVRVSRRGFPARTGYGGHERA